YQHQGVPNKVAVVLLSQFKQTGTLCFGKTKAVQGSEWQVLKNCLLIRAAS
ncbi:hypothetical protein ATANTOWER_007913, partial [Ataeniobius toweri]|nr:hypothetical protein [Ataeniobius toweri]